jgi:hypothetical protein
MRYSHGTRKQHVKSQDKAIGFLHAIPLKSLCLPHREKNDSERGKKAAIIPVLAVGCVRGRRGGGGVDQKHRLEQKLIC